MNTRLHLLTLDERALPSTTNMFWNLHLSGTVETNTENVNAAPITIEQITSILGEDDEIASMITAFEEANGEFVIVGAGENRPGGFFPTGEGGSNHPVIVIAPNVQGVEGNLAITAGVTLFELIRASHTHQQESLDDQVKSGQLIPEQFANASEALTIQYIIEHQELIGNLIESGGVTAGANIFNEYESMTEVQMLERLIQSGHWQDVKDRGQRMRNEVLAAENPVEIPPPPSSSN